VIECPACGNQEFVGTLYCGECGTRLVHTSPLSGAVTTKEAVAQGVFGEVPVPPDTVELQSGVLLGLRVLGTDEILPLIGRENYTLGRSGEGQAVIPDIDLTQFAAFESGVSRIHSEIRLTEQTVAVVDLDSANGTLVNNARLEPQKPVPIRHGDIIQLGQLRLQLISRYH
jgi:hypothetical protein